MNQRVQEVFGSPKDLAEKMLWGYEFDTELQVRTAADRNEKDIVMRDTTNRTINQDFEFGQIASDFFEDSDVDVIPGKVMTTKFVSPEYEFTGELEGRVNFAIEQSFDELYKKDPNFGIDYTVDYKTDGLVVGTDLSRSVVDMDLRVSPEAWVSASDGVKAQLEDINHKNGIALIADPDTGKPILTFDQEKVAAHFNEPVEAFEGTLGAKAAEAVDEAMLTAGLDGIEIEDQQQI